MDNLHILKYVYAFINVYIYIYIFIYIYIYIHIYIYVPTYIWIFTSFFHIFLVGKAKRQAVEAIEERSLSKKTVGVERPRRLRCPN